MPMQLLLDYLADAELKAEIQRALKSIEKAISINSGYPDKDGLLKLKEEILLKLNI